MYGDRRVAGLEDPRVHDPADRLPRLLADRVPQIVRLGVGVRVGAQVPPDPVTEAVAAKPLLKHPKHGAALRVREGVEHAARVVGRVHRVLDRTRRLQRVDLEGVRTDALEHVEDPPIRLHRIHAQVGHEGRERFVQPDPVPPTHRDQVSEPHVRELVRDRLRDVEALREGRERIVHEQERLAVGHEPGVLHRALREVGDRGLVELRLGISDVVVVSEPVQREHPDVAREAREVLLPGAAGDPEWDAARVRRFGDDEPSDDHADQVGRHDHGVREPDPDPAVGERAPFDLRRVGQRGQPIGRDDRDAEGRLEVGLVPTRETHPGVGRLEVGSGDHVRGALVVVPRSVEANHPVVERSAEPEAKDPLPRRGRLGEPHRHPFGPRVQDDLLQVDRGTVRGLERAVQDLELLRVEDDLGHRFVHGHGDRFVAVERRRVERRLQGEVVPRWGHAPREAVGGLGIRRRLVIHAGLSRRRR